MKIAPCSCDESLVLRARAERAEAVVIDQAKLVLRLADMERDLSTARVQVEDAALIIAGLLNRPAQYTIAQAALWLARWAGHDCAVCREPTTDTDRLPFGACVALAACAMKRTVGEG